ncbi:MAG: hypothetical protein NTZ49_05655 [Candidatus Parcubacteria bacterium]|nr:hypothetical protein [Candidatus Parcubacteria bacterium]
MPFESNKPEKNEVLTKRDRLYNELQKIGELLKKSGMTLWQSLDNQTVFNEQWEQMQGAIYSYPLVMDGANGIRANIGKRENNWTITFTNGFEELTNPKRQEVTKLLRDNGFNAI